MKCCTYLWLGGQSSPLIKLNLQISTFGKKETMFVTMYQSASCRSTVADLSHLVINRIILNHYLWWMHDITSSSVTDVERFYTMSWNVVPTMFTCSILYCLAASHASLSAFRVSLLSSCSWPLCLSSCSHFAPHPCRPL